jgi:hypothetical protein
LVLDLIFCNCSQAKTGNADVEAVMIGRVTKGLEDRIREKIAKIKEMRIQT